MKQFSLSGLIIGFLLLSMNSHAQTIRYYYDAVGNRIEKVIDLGEGKGSGITKNTKKIYKEPAIVEDTISKKVIKDETFPDQQIRIYPNPTKGLIRLEIPNDPENYEPIQIIVQDINGKMLINKPNESLVTEVDLSNQPEGIYILKLKRGIKTSQWKIIKHK
jgi:YD repeat-containing protein